MINKTKKEKLQDVLDEVRRGGGGIARAGSVLSFGHSAQKCGTRSAGIHNVDLPASKCAARF